MIVTITPQDVEVNVMAYKRMGWYIKELDIFVLSRLVRALRRDGLSTLTICERELYDIAARELRYRWSH